MKNALRLPIDALLPVVVAALETSRNLVIEAAPGAGKTTRVPPALLPFGDVLVLEPRRLAARLAARRGKQKAIIALAHKILVIVYTLLKTGQVYEERGAAALSERQKERIVHRLERRIAQLGYKVNLEPLTAAVA